MVGYNKGNLLQKLVSLFGHCPFGGGGGLNACQDDLGHLFREELSKFKNGHLLDCLKMFINGSSSTEDERKI